MKKKIALLGAALGVVGGLVYALESQWRRNQAAKTNNESDKNSQSRPAASMATVENQSAANAQAGQHVLDDQGTDQAEASQILRSIRDRAFDSSDEKLALALGRPAEEISEWTAGNSSVDGDVLMKARTLAMQRGFEI